MIINSKYSSLYLGSEDNWKAPFDLDKCYIQKFAPKELIRIQFIGFAPSFTVVIDDEIGTLLNVPAILLKTDEIDNQKRLFETEFSISTAGTYRLSLTSSNDNAQTYFRISEDLERTVLLSYTHRKNEYDTIFEGRRFNFRIDGGIYPGDAQQALFNETFRDQRINPHQTTAEAYKIDTLTIGQPRGVPAWVGNKINHIFNVSDVYLNGNEIVRNENSIPEIIAVGDNYPLYVFKLKVELDDAERVYSIPDEEDLRYLVTNSSIPILTNSGIYITVPTVKKVFLAYFQIGDELSGKTINFNTIKQVGHNVLAEPETPGGPTTTNASGKYSLKGENDWEVYFSRYLAGGGSAPLVANIEITLRQNNVLINQIFKGQYQYDSVTDYWHENFETWIVGSITLPIEFGHITFNGHTNPVFFGSLASGYFSKWDVWYNELT